MNDENFKIVMSCYDKSITVDRNYPDVSIFDAVEDVVTCLIGLTFSKKQIIEGFSKYMKENSKNEIY